MGKSLLRTKLQDLVEAAFPDGTLRLDAIAMSGRVGGLLIWKGFEAMDQVARHSSVGEVLREKLTAEEYLKVGAILTITPEEYELMHEAQRAAEG